MRTERARTTRDQLVEAATALFAEQGYEGTSIEAVLRATGVSRGALYHHFASKVALFEAVYAATEARVASEVIEEAAGADDPRSAIRRGARVWLYLVRDPVVRQITLIDAPSVLGWERWREIDEEHFLGIVRATVREAMGETPIDERVDLLAHMLLAMLGEVAMVLARGEQSNAAIEDAAAAVDHFLSRLLG